MLEEKLEEFHFTAEIIYPCRYLSPLLHSLQEISFCKKMCERNSETELFYFSFLKVPNGILMNVRSRVIFVSHSAEWA